MSLPRPWMNWGQRPVTWRTRWPSRLARGTCGAPWRLPDANSRARHCRFPRPGLVGHAPGQRTGATEERHTRAAGAAGGRLLPHEPHHAATRSAVRRLVRDCVPGDPKAWSVTRIRAGRSLPGAGHDSGGQGLTGFGPGRAVPGRHRAGRRVLRRRHGPCREQMGGTARTSGCIGRGCRAGWRRRCPATWTVSGPPSPPGR